MMSSSTPLINAKLTAIYFDLKSACLSCGDYYTDNQRSHLTGEEMNTWLLNMYAQQLKEEVKHSGIFDEHSTTPVILAVKLSDLDHKYSLGINADRDHPFTSGGHLLNTVKMHYELRSEGSTTPLATWNISTRGSSDSTAPQHRMEEGMRFALLRSIKAFVFELKRSLRPGLTQEEEKLYLQTINSGKDKTRSSFGELMLNSGRTVNKVSNSISSGATAFFSALGSAEVQAYTNSVLNDMRATNSVLDQQFGSAINPHASRASRDINYHLSEQSQTSESVETSPVEIQKISNSVNLDDDPGNKVSTERENPPVKTQNSGTSRKGTSNGHLHSSITLTADHSAEEAERKHREKMAAEIKAADEAHAQEMTRFRAEQQAEKARREEQDAAYCKTHRCDGSK